jgi:hypothetical protein
MGEIKNMSVRAIQVAQTVCAFLFRPVSSFELKDTVDTDGSEVQSFLAILGNVKSIIACLDLGSG